MSLTGKLPLNSDESNSTEHDATVSLSGTDEFNDTHSVFSETASVTSRSSKHLDAKKTLYKLNKLKEENIVLKESLEKANATDITMLKAKLRGSNADLVRLRQNNSELKDRIQVLEGRLFSALSAQTISSRKVAEVPVKSVSFADDDRGSAATPVITMEEAPVPVPKVEKMSDHDRGHLMDMIKSLQSRCKHLARLVQSYETKIGILQESKDSLSESIPHNTETGPSTASTTVEFDTEDSTSTGNNMFDSEAQLPLKSALKHNEQSKNFPSKATPVKAARSVKMQQSEAESLIAQARADDLKMIKELSAEIKRLVALVPRNEIEKSESSNNENETVKTSEETDETEHRHLNRSSSHASATASGNNATALSSGRRKDPVLGSAKHVARSSTSELLCSFFAGVLIMLLCVAITGYSSIGLGGGDSMPAKE